MSKCMNIFAINMVTLERNDKINTHVLFINIGYNDGAVVNLVTSLSYQFAGSIEQGHYCACK